MLSRELLVQLNLVSGIGPIAIRMLEEAAQGRELQTRDAVREVLARSRLSEAAAALVMDGLSDNRGIRELELCARARVDIVTWHDAAYPELLRAIHAPPPVLYVRGDLSILRSPCVAIVGSRGANAYGLQVVDAFVPSMVADGWTVVSGGARGIDARAHRVTLRDKGATAVVLGSGLLRPYPAEHASLFDQIAEQGGCVMSPFGLEAGPLPGNFPARNRVIAGLSRGVVVVQAAAQSGALITATRALDEGRDVGAVPGSIFDPLSAGVNRLLAQGATPLVDAESLLQWLRTMHAPPVHKAVRMNHATQTEIAIGIDPLVQFCTTPRMVEECVREFQIEEATLYNRLWELQVAGQVAQTLSGRWKSTAHV